jgi:hypothetical protein
MLRSWLTFVYFARSGSWGSLLILDGVFLESKRLLFLNSPTPLFRPSPPDRFSLSTPRYRSAPVVLCALDDLPSLLMVIAIT